jgi:hypothetical protein
MKGRTKKNNYCPDCLRLIAALMENDTEQVQAVKMIGLHCKNLTINLFRIYQSIALV